jgi:hypothetical protein
MVEEAEEARDLLHAQAQAGNPVAAEALNLRSRDPWWARVDHINPPGRPREGSRRQLEVRCEFRIRQMVEECDFEVNLWREGLEERDRATAAAEADT